MLDKAVDVEIRYYEGYNMLDLTAMILTKEYRCMY